MGVPGKDMLLTTNLKVKSSSTCTSLYQPGIIYKGGRGWYLMCSRQPSVGLVVTEIEQNAFIAIFKWTDNCTSSRLSSPL
jgi:hypothetical protein